MMKYENTYCNPIPLPDYPIGRTCYYWKVNEDFRETADPTVIYEGGVWYLYSSCGMAYYSEDFIHWKHKRLETYDVGYAPTVVKYRGRFLMTACSADLYTADSPLGEFKSIGKFTDLNGEIVPAVDDPMIFADDDGRLYLYWGCGYEIKGVELDGDCPTKFITEPKVLIRYNPEHVWERIGDWNEDGTYSWTEGAYMIKRGETYYLTYSAPGTEWVTYAMGAYKSKSPLDGFEYMESSPFLTQRHGLIKGPGHGSIVEGPNNTLWVFYTCVVCYCNQFERRIGMEPCGINENGDLFVNGTTEIPQWAPGVLEHPELGNGCGIVPLTCHREVSATSSAPGRSAVYGADDSMMTWWQPACDDPAPALTVGITKNGLNVHAVRVIWRDVGLDIKKNIMPGAFQYTVDVLDMNGEWVQIIDKSKNTADMLIDYIPVDEIRATKMRLNVLGSPAGISPGVVNFCVFGSWK